MRGVYIEEVLRDLEAQGLLSDIGELSGGFEVTREAYRRRNPFVFRLAGGEFRLYSNIYADRRLLYRFLGAGDDAAAYTRLLEATRNPGRVVETGFSEFFRETGRGLSDLPFLRYYREDGGRYLTSSIVLACAGDDVCNASFHRMMLVGDREAAIRIVPRHLYRIVEWYRRRGRDAPAAVVLGVHPLIELAAATSPGYGVYELGVAAGLLGEGLEVARTPLYGIPVPSSASVVVEGRITGRLVEEGPFVDILGIPDRVRRQPVFVAERIYYRRGSSPHYHAIVPGLDEHLLLMGFPREALVYEACSRLAGVRAVRLTRGSGGWLHIVVSVNDAGAGAAANIGMAALSAHPSAKLVVVVDDDIDIDDPWSIEWALATRVRWGRDVYVLRGVRGSTLDPSGDDGLLDKAIIDATVPRDRPGALFRRARVPVGGDPG